jgi:hypothetical protein
MLSIRGNNFIAHWAYKETISSPTEHTPNELLCMLSQHSNFDRFYMDIWTHVGHTRKRFLLCWAYAERISSDAEHARKQFHRTLSILGNDFIACWAYVEMISSLAEHTRKQCHCTWVHSEQIFVSAQPAFKFWQFLHGHPNACWANAEMISLLAKHMRKQFYADWVKGETTDWVKGEISQKLTSQYGSDLWLHPASQSELGVRHLWAPYCIHPFILSS